MKNDKIFLCSKSQKKTIENDARKRELNLFLIILFTYKHILLYSHIYINIHIYVNIYTNIYSNTHTHQTKYIHLKSPM